MKIGAKSHKGMVRNINEDSYYASTQSEFNTPFFVIADGMGGHNCGEIASKIAVETANNNLLKFHDFMAEYNSVEDVLIEIIGLCNSSIFSKSLEDESYSGMGTTIIVAVVYENKLYLGHVGDSRAYLIRDSSIIRLTTDHSFIEELIKTGSLTREEAYTHPKKNLITRAVGCVEKVEVDTYNYEIQNNDIYILCTDGLTNMITEEEILNIVLKVDDAESACDRLIEIANEKGGEDNITVIIFNDK